MAKKTRQQAAALLASATLLGTTGVAAAAATVTESQAPVATPSESPFVQPSVTPTVEPTATPSTPQAEPSVAASETLSDTPSETPSTTPSVTPSVQPSEQASAGAENPAGLTARNSLNNPSNAALEITSISCGSQDPCPTPWGLSEAVQINGTGATPNQPVAMQNSTDGTIWNDGGATALANNDGTFSITAIGPNVTLKNLWRVIDRFPDPELVSGSVTIEAVAPQAVITGQSTNPVPAGTGFYVSAEDFYPDMPVQAELVSCIGSNPCTVVKDFGNTQSDQVTGNLFVTDMIPADVPTRDYKIRLTQQGGDNRSIITDISIVAPQVPTAIASPKEVVNDGTGKVGVQLLDLPADLPEVTLPYAILDMQGQVVVDLGTCTKPAGALEVTCPQSTVPAGKLTAGQQYQIGVNATGLLPGWLTDTFTAIAGPTPSTPKVNPATVVEGKSFKTSGSGFTSSDYVDCKFEGSQEVIASGFVGNNGDFTTGDSIVIDKNPGSYTLVCSDFHGKSAQTTLTVTAAPTPTPTPTPTPDPTPSPTPPNPNPTPNPTPPNPNPAPGPNPDPFPDPFPNPGPQPLPDNGGYIPPGYIGDAYNWIVAPAGASGCYIASGALPAGLQLIGCDLVGSPLFPGNYDFTIGYTNADGSQGEQRYVWEIEQTRPGTQQNSGSNVDATGNPFAQEPAYVAGSAATPQGNSEISTQQNEPTQVASTSSGSGLTEAIKTQESQQNSSLASTGMSDAAKTALGVAGIATIAGVSTVMVAKRRKG